MPRRRRPRGRPRGPVGRHAIGCLVAALAPGLATTDLPVARALPPAPHAPGTTARLAQDGGMTAPLVELLRDGHAVFGIFSGDHTAEQGAAMADNAELDFVFYSLERGPFDIPQMGQYIGGLREGSGGAPHPLVLRVPPVGDDPEATRARVDEAIEAGVAGIVFPHVRTATEAASAVAALGDRHWPANPDGDLVSMLIIEDREGVENARAIVATGGASVVFAGPGDLSRAYERDMDAVEGAIQTVLSACNEHSVPCGITAGADDIAARIEQGFRVIIVTQPEALSVGRRAAGRTQ